MVGNWVWGIWNLEFGIGGWGLVVRDWVWELVGWTFFSVSTADLLN